MLDSNLAYSPGRGAFIHPLAKFFLFSHCRKNLGAVQSKFAFGTSLKITIVWWEHRAAPEFTGAS